MLTAAEAKAIYTNGLTQNEFSTLYAPVNYIYDASGNRQTRLITVTKFDKYISTPDSSEKSLEKPYNSVDSSRVTDIYQLVKIYPNPTQGQVQVDISATNESKKAIYLYNTNGKLVTSKLPAGSSSTIDLSDFTNGIYIMRIVVGDKKGEWKIVKD